MALPLEITFHNMERSDAVEARVREKVDYLAKLADRLTGCRVTVEAPHRHHQKGNTYQVRILLDMPQGQVIVSRDPGDANAHKDVFVAIRDAFDAAERQLKERREKLRGDVKTHEVPVQGRIGRLFPMQDYGFILTNDGREIYFHRNAVIGAAFDDLEPGRPVELVIFVGDGVAGPHASTVKPISAMSYRPQ